MINFFLLVKTIFFLLAIILLIRITLTYLNKFNKKQAKSIEIIEQLSVGKESSIAIVLICGKHYLMSIGTTKNELMKELDESEVQELLNQKRREVELREAQQTKMLNQMSSVKSYFKKNSKETKNEESN